MAIEYYLHRFVRYYKDKGFLAILKRIIQIIRRAIFEYYDYIYCADILNLDTSKLMLSDALEIECISRREDISDRDLDAMVAYRFEDMVNEQMMERFSCGAKIWLARYQNNLVGFTWSINKTSKERFYFPLSEHDVLFFDAAIFPEYRGKNIFPAFHSAILLKLQHHGFVRGYIAVHSWNKPVIRSLKKYSGYNGFRGAWLKPCSWPHPSSCGQEHE